MFQNDTKYQIATLVGEAAAKSTDVEPAVIPPLAEPLAYRDDSAETIETVRWSAVISIAVAMLSIAALAAGGVLKYGHANIDNATPASITRATPELTLTSPSTIEPTPTTTPTTTATTIPDVSATEMPPAASPTQVATPPLSTPTTTLTPAWVAVYDREFLNQLHGLQWIITDPMLVTHNAHRVCAMLQQGESQTDVIHHIASESNLTYFEATQYALIAMRTYPQCP